MTTPTAPPQTLGFAGMSTVRPGNVAGLPDPSIPLRRLLVLVLLLSSFALSLTVLFRAHQEMASVSPGDREAPEVAAAPLAP